MSLGSSFVGHTVQRQPSAMAGLSACSITGDRIGSPQPFVTKWRPGHRRPGAESGDLRYDGRMTKVRLHHIKFALAESWWLFPFFIGFAALIVSIRGGTVVDFLWGAAPGVIVSVGYFVYRLWRTQQRL